MPCGRPAPGTGQAAPGRGSPSAGVVVPAASWRIQRIRSAAAWGRSPNSCAIRPAQPQVPSRRTVRLIASVTLSAVGTSDRCSSEANRASHRAPSTFNRVITPPLVSRLKRLTGPTLPRRVSLVKRLTVLSYEHEVDEPGGLELLNRQDPGRGGPMVDVADPPRRVRGHPPVRRLPGQPRPGPQRADRPAGETHRPRDPRTPRLHPAPAPLRVPPDRKGPGPLPGRYGAADLGRPVGTHPRRTAGPACPRHLREHHRPGADMPALPYRGHRRQHPRPARPGKQPARRCGRRRVSGNVRAGLAGGVAALYPAFAAREFYDPMPGALPRPAQPGRRLVAGTHAAPPSARAARVRPCSRARCLPPPEP